jgi:hypothetical protein
MQRRYWPEEIDPKYQSPSSNILKALLTRRESFEGPKPELE